MKISVRTLSGLLALSALACGSSSDGSSSSSSSSSGSSVPLEDVPGLYADAACDAYLACLGPIADVFFAGEDCATRITRQLEEEWPRIEDAVDRGTVEYHGDQIEACAEDLRNRSCQELTERETCPDALDGTVAIGDDCSLSAECKGEAYCNFDASCPGTCRALEPAGGNCRDDDQCVSGLVCSSDTQRCVVPAGEGQACQAGEPDCELGLFCAGANETSNTSGECRPIDDVFGQANGQDCDFDSGRLCASDLVCQVDSVDTDGLHLSCARRVGSGEACRLAVPDQCPEDEFCNVLMQNNGENMPLLEGNCEPRPAAGEACATTLIGTYCAAYTRCDNGTCRELANLGERCSTDEVCLSEHCDGTACVSQDQCR
jgi:hypothetical protein